MLTLFKAIESVKMGLKRVKKKIGGEKIGPRLGKKIDRLEVYTSPMERVKLQGKSGLLQWNIVKDIIPCDNG